MDLPRHDVDPDGLLEYSVVFTDRSLNHMSHRFAGVMEEILRILRTTYNAQSAAVVSGGGTFAMEAVARQVAGGRRAVVVRNGYFSYRWSEILEAGAITDQVTVCPAVPDSESRDAAWSPMPIDELVEQIHEVRPEVVFAAHVETASGILLPDDYVRSMATAVHDVGGLFVLDCVASGAIWVDMEDLGVDLLLSAPQKGWSGSPCAGYVMVGERGRTAIEESTSSSFALDLKKWLAIADGYAAGRHGYHATMPTDALEHNAAQMRETVGRGLDVMRAAQEELGARVRRLLAERGFASVAADGFAAPSVVVVHTADPDLKNGARFIDAGLQIAGGVALMCGEPEDFSTFRLGLFGLDKLGDIDGTVARLEAALDRIGALATV